MTNENGGDTPPASAPPRATPLRVQNGTFTVDHPTAGHFTLKVYTAQNGDLAGKRIVAMLTGPDNVTNYRGVAFWNDAELRVDVWRRHRSPDRTASIDGYNYSERWNIVEKKLAIWADLAIRGASDERHGYWYESGYRLLHEGVCVVCNRKLTDPESIRTGIGPTCAGRS